MGTFTVCGSLINQKHTWQFVQDHPEVTATVEIPDDYSHYDASRLVTDSFWAEVVRFMTDMGFKQDPEEKSRFFRWVVLARLPADWVQTGCGDCTDPLYVELERLGIRFDTRRGGVASVEEHFKRNGYTTVIARDGKVWTVKCKEVVQVFRGLAAGSEKPPYTRYSYMDD